MLIPAFPPRCLIAGTFLTQDQAKHLLSAVATLQKLLTQHISAIDSLELPDSISASYLWQIHDRQALIQKLLTQLVSETKASTALSVHEISDLHESALCKVRVCNCMSELKQMGWKPAAAKYYPLIAANYADLLPLLGRLSSELGDALNGAAEWSCTTNVPLGGVVKGWFRSSAAAPRAVAFDRDVRARRIVTEADEPMPQVSDFVVPLISERKRTNRKKLRCAPASQGENGVENGEWRDDIGDGIDVASLMGQASQDNKCELR